MCITVHRYPDVQQPQEAQQQQQQQQEQHHPLVEDPVFDNYFDNVDGDVD